MAEAPDATLQRAVPGLRAKADMFVAHGRLQKFYVAVAELFEAIAHDMAGSEAFVCSRAGGVSSEIEGFRTDWTAALTAARAYLGELEVADGA